MLRRFSFHTVLSNADNIPVPNDSLWHLNPFFNGEGYAACGPRDAKRRI